MVLKKRLKREAKNLFHFYIILGNIKKNYQEVRDFLKEDFDILLKSNPELYIFDENILSIDKARKIKKINSTKNQNNLRIFLIKSQKIERETQNALLKTFEEAGQNTIFFLFLPQEVFLLGTIKSRARILKGEEDFFNYDFARNFLNSSFLERQKIIDKISTNKKEDTKWKREQFLNLIFDLEILIWENSKKLNLDSSFVDFYKEFLELKEQAFKKGSNLKNILIYLAITCPKM